MCGIAGVVANVGRVAESRAEVERMCRALERRGPDGITQEAYGGAVLGHARLAIIDLQTGDQPQGNADDSVVTVVNGEIYNYVELRRDLEAEGVRFKTRSDVEVIPHLYERHGLDFVDRLRGMFAIALWDRKSERLVLVRDRLGKKPVYWTEMEGRFLFASELKALLTAPGLSRDVDPRAADAFFTFQYIPAPLTILQGVSKLPAAHLLVHDGAGTRIREYWRPPMEDSVTDEGAALERIEETLRESTRIRLRSDVPLGVFLSGGIDSGLVVEEAQSLSSRPLKATTILFSDDDAAEMERIERLATSLGLVHEKKRMNEDVSSVLDEVTGYLDEPFGDSSALPSFMVSRATRSEVKVALSGDGGDETFGGYAWRYGQNLAIDRVRSHLSPSLRRVVGAVARAYPKLDGFPKPMRLKWGLRNLSVSPEEAYFLDMSIFRPEDKGELYGRDFRASLEGWSARRIMEERFRDAGEGDLLRRLLHVDLKSYLADGVLTKVDRMSMANSLEVRSPLLDQEMVDLAFRIPAELKMRGKRSKYLLRRLAERKLGADWAGAPKRGFAPPLAGWMRHELSDVFRERVLGARGGLGDFLDVSALQRRFDAHSSGRRDHARILWLALVFATWLERFGRRAP